MELDVQAAEAKLNDAIERYGKVSKQADALQGETYHVVRCALVHFILRICTSDDPTAEEPDAMVRAASLIVH